MKRTLLTLSLLGVATLGVSSAQAQTVGQPLPRGMASPFNATAEEVLVKQSVRDAGYAGVTDMQRNTDGSWHVQAYKDNAYFDVTVDRAGHVTQN